jgi:hypothetical protein
MPKTRLKADKTVGIIILDSQTELHATPTLFFLAAIPK